MLLTCILCCFGISAAYFIHIDANEEQCFFDRVTTGTKMGLMFEVAEGGFLDIDVKVIVRIVADFFFFKLCAQKISTQVA